MKTAARSGVRGCRPTRQGGGSLFTLFFRAMILYVLMILVMRAMGKGQLGQFQPYELVMAILLADIFATPMASVSTPLLYGIVPVAALFVVHGIITLLCMRFDRVRAFISGKPVVVIERGEIKQDEMRRLCISLSDLLEGLRGAGILDPSRAETAILEANGTLTAFTASRNRPPEAGEMNVPTQYEGMPLMLIMDGRVQSYNLQASGRDEAWLDSLLRPRNLRPRDVYLAALDTAGKLTLSLRGGGMLRFAAMRPDEVIW